MIKTDYSRIYLRFHTDTPEHIAAMTAYFRRILKPHLPQDKESKIFDVGCGMGFAMMALKQLGYNNVSGCDSDEKQVQYCLKNGLDVIQTEDTAAWLSKTKSMYDAILALDLIEHVPVAEQLEFTHTLLEALKPGAFLIGTVPNASSSLALRSRHICFTHHTSFTEHSLDFLLYNAGFENIVIQEVEYITAPPNLWIPKAAARHWWALKFFRFWRRLQMMAELGPAQGRLVPLSLNLIFSATRKRNP